jgi:hypothetical protein
MGALEFTENSTVDAREFYGDVLIRPRGAAQAFGVA